LIDESEEVLRAVELKIKDVGLRGVQGEGLDIGRQGFLLSIDILDSQSQGTGIIQDFVTITFHTPSG
jgi:hypothetical protein